MKCKTISILAFLIFSHSLTWALDKSLIDPEYKKIEEKIEKITLECEEKEKNRMKRFKCGHKVINKYEQEGKIRGTEEYCEVNYTNMSFSEFEKLFQKLRTQQKTARSSMDLMWDDELPGEVTKEDLQTELMWVESRLARMQKEKARKMEKGLKYLPGWEPKKE